MRERLFPLLAAVVVATTGAAVSGAASAATPPFTASVVATTHTPQVLTKWRYTVTVRNRVGTPMNASLRVTVLENGKRVNTIGWFVIRGGRFTQTIRWYPNTKGHSLVFRATVIAKGTSRKLDFWVKPH